jgi:hypothetical protein
MVAGQRIGQVLGFLILIEVLSVGEQIENEDFHRNGPGSIPAGLSA